MAAATRSTAVRAAVLAWCTVLVVAQTSNMTATPVDVLEIEYPQEREEFPEGLPVGCVVMIVVIGGVLLLACVAVAVMKIIREHVPLAVLVGIGVCAGLAVVGTVSWAVSYIQTRDIIQSLVESRIHSTANVIRTSVLKELQAGISMLTLIRAGVINDHYTLTNAYPGAYRTVLAVAQSLPLSTIHLLYYGTRGNEDAYAPGGPSIVGVIPYRPDASAIHPAPDEWIVYTQPEYNSTLPDFVYCDARDRNETPGECAAYTCGTSADLDFKCQATCSGATLTRGNDVITLPSRTAAFCTYYPSGTEKRRTLLFKATYNQLESPVIAPLPGLPVPYASNGGKAYNPMERPWWHNATTVRLSSPYVFSSSGSVGITGSTAVYNSRGVFVGVAAVDFTLLSLGRLLQQQLPTANARMYIADVHGNLISSSMPVQELLDDVQVPPRTIINLDRLGTTRSFTGYAFGVLLEHCPTGGLADATIKEYTLHHNDWLFFSAPIVGLVEGTRWLLLIGVPTSDVMDESDTAAQQSLGATIGVSLFVSVLLFIVVKAMLVPLHGLGSDMHRVALMDLSGMRDQGSSVSEVAAMQTSFLAMVNQLMEYRSFLPPAILERAQKDELGFTTCAIVFTDIRHSTALWEKAPMAMARGLSVHNAVIRHQIRAYEGCEIKTIGDSFMVSFDTAECACLFGIAVQEALFSADWPAELLQLPEAEESEDGAWRGMNIRVGINYGEVEARTENKRLDFFGQVVNVAARVEGQCIPGAVCITPAVRNEVTLADLNNPAVVEMGRRNMKGLQQAMDLVLLVPHTFAARITAIHAALCSYEPNENDRLCSSGSDNAPVQVASIPPARLRQSSAGRLSWNQKINDGTIAEISSHGSEDSDLSMASVRRSARNAAPLADRLYPTVQTIAKTSFRVNSASHADTEYAVEHTILQPVEAIFTAAHNTNATVLYVHGNAVLMSWVSNNGGLVRSTRDAFRYIGLLRSRTMSMMGEDALVFKATPMLYETGVVTGAVLRGAVGTDKQMFVTEMGSAAAVVDIVLAACRDLQVQALYTALDRSNALRYPAVRRMLRPVDRLVFDGATQSSGNLPIIYQVHPHREREGAASRTWAERYDGLFMAEDVEGIRAMAQEESDDVLAAVADRMASATRWRTVPAGVVVSYAEMVAPQRAPSGWGPNPLTVTSPAFISPRRAPTLDSGSIRMFSPASTGSASVAPARPESLPPAGDDSVRRFSNCSFAERNARISPRGGDTPPNIKACESVETSADIAVTLEQTATTQPSASPPVGVEGVEENDGDVELSSVRTPGVSGSDSQHIEHGAG